MCRVSGTSLPGTDDQVYQRSITSSSSFVVPLCPSTTTLAAPSPPLPPRQALPLAEPRTPVKDFLRAASALYSECQHATVCHVYRTLRLHKDVHCLQPIIQPDLPSVSSTLPSYRRSLPSPLSSVNIDLYRWQFANCRVPIEPRKWTNQERGCLRGARGVGVA